MEQLHFISVLNLFSFAPFEDLIVSFNFLIELFKKLDHSEFVLLWNSLFIAARFRWRLSLFKIGFEVVILSERVVLHTRHYLENKITHVSLVHLAFTVPTLNEALGLGDESRVIKWSSTYPYAYTKPCLVVRMMQSPNLRRLSSLFIYFIIIK